MGICAADDSADEELLGGYHNNKKLFFKPTESSTFKLVKLGNVNVTFLDKTNLLGYDGQDFAKVGSFTRHSAQSLLAGQRAAFSL